MMQATLSPKFFRPAVMLVALGALAGCGGGSSGDGSSGGPGPSPTTGTVAILFTDGPTDQFCQVLATVESIDLLGTNGPTNVFTGSETVDVLAMRNYTDVFSIDTEVPVGSYEKIRLTLSDLALVECDPETMIAEEPAGWEHPKLPGNGKLDLNPRGSFQIVGGETVMIEIDLDMEKSLHMHQTGNGKWQFRPVIFVDIKPNDTKLVRVFGQVRDLSGTNFELCPTEPASSTDDDTNGMGGDMSGDDDSGRCIDVVAGGAGIFNESGDPVGIDAFTNGDLLTAIGFLGMHDDDDDGDSHMDDLKLDAKVIELGDQDTFQRIQGEVVSAPGTNDIFVFDRTPADKTDALTSDIDVRYQAGTKIFALGSNAVLGTDAIQPLTKGEVDGVFTVPATSGEPLKSSLIVLDVDARPLVSLIERTVGSTTAVAPATTPPSGTITLVALDPPVTYNCVKTTVDTRFIQITESSDSSETAEIDFAALASGNVIDVFGEQDTGDTTCVLADTVQKYVPATP